MYINDKKEFYGKDIDFLESNVKVAIKALMIYWKLKNLNQIADSGIENSTIDEVGRKVDGIRGTGLPNGWENRRKFTKTTFDNIK